MIKILLSTVMILNLNATAQAADGSCSVLLGASDSKSNLGNYIKELFDEGVVTEEELISFRDALSHGERINPIRNPELDIARYIAFEKIEIFLNKDFEIDSISNSIQKILGDHKLDVEKIDDITGDITGMALNVITANSEELVLLIQDYFSKPESVNDYRALRLVIERATAKELYYCIVHIFSKPHWSRHPELLSLAIKKSPEKYMSYYSMYVFSNANWARYPAVLRLALVKAKSIGYDSFIEHVFSKECWSSNPELLRFVIENSQSGGMSKYAESIFSKNYWSSQLELFRLIIEKSGRFVTGFYLGPKRFLSEYYPNESKLIAACDIEHPPWRADFLRKELGPYSWEGTEQENLEEYLDKLYGRIDE